MLRSRIGTKVINDILDLLGMGSIDVCDYLLFLEPSLAVAAFNAFKVAAV